MFKNNRFLKRKYFFLIFIFSFLLCVLGLGYASLQTNLNLVGNTNIDKTTWDVHFDNIQILGSNSVVLEDDAIPKIGALGNEITFNIDLTGKNKQYEFTFDVVNDGSVDAKIGTIISEPILTNEQKNIFDYKVSYLNDDEVLVNDLLEHGTKRTIKVSFITKDYSDSLLEDDEVILFKYKLEYIQNMSKK